MTRTLSPPVAIRGCGCIAAVGGDCETALENLQACRVNTTLLSADYFPEPFTAPCFLVTQKGAHSAQSWTGLAQSHGLGCNRTILLALTAIDEALTTAGYSLKELTGKRVGLALGTTVGCTFHNESYYLDWKNGKIPDSQPLYTYFASNLAECIQELLGIHGPRIVVTNACASGTDAIGIAKSWLEYGLCDVAIAGGVDELSRIACNGFKSLMLVSEERCRPFAKDRQGLNLGEGAGMLVLERENEALSAKRKIMGWIRGYGTAGDAYHPTAPHPQGAGLQRAISQALADAAVSLTDIALINAHGTGTAANDKAETRAIFDMGFDTAAVPVVSTKGVTGHTLGAAGGIEAVFTLLSLKQGEVCGTVGCVNPDPELPFAVLPEGEKAALNGTMGISQSLAFGGSNSVLVIEGYGT